MTHWSNVFRILWSKYYETKNQPLSLMQQNLQKIDLTPSSLKAMYHIRAANYGDLLTFVDLQQAGYQGYVAWQTRDFVKDWATNPGLWYLVLTERKTDQVIGLCTGRVNHSKGHLSQLIIHPPYQQQGLGKILFNIWLEGAQKMDAQTITLETRKSDPLVQQFYEQFGFQRIALRKNYYPDLNDDAYIMQWQKGSSR
ncbi:ribosomal protein S18-alanine N-acetyltransferase [Dolosicoccus paucivorans]